MADNKVYQMTPADMEALQAGASHPNKFFEHFFCKKGLTRAWQLDYNFDDDGKWQENVVLAKQTFIVVVGGIGTGKTLGTIMGAAFLAAYLEGFRFLNVGKESWQSQIMYTLLLEQAEGTLFEKLITSKPRRPYPQIVIEYEFQNYHHKATFEFLSIGEEKDATNIFSWRGDIISIEEAVLIPNLAEIVANLSTRLTGNTAAGREYMGRLVLLSNAWDNPELWQMFDAAANDPDEGLAINVNTKANKNVTARQLKNSLSKIAEEDQERFITGQRPENTGGFYSKDVVERGRDEILAKKLKDAIDQTPALISAKWTAHMGIYNFSYPRIPGRIYYIIGDPGTGTAPLRNAPCIMVWDVTDGPKVCTLESFYWGNGNGSIYPFLYRLLAWLKKYAPDYAGIDSTATQKNMAEIVNMEYIYGKGYSVDHITGLDFSGGRRFAYLNALRLCLEGGNLRWPANVIGISGQLTAYDPIADRSANTKLAQDIVSTMAMSAAAIRSQLVEDDQTDENESDENGPKGIRYRRSTSRNTRSTPRDAVTPR